jgi:hypothetical protein
VNNLFRRSSLQVISGPGITTGGAPPRLVTAAASGGSDPSGGGDRAAAADDDDDVDASAANAEIVAQLRREATTRRSRADGYSS